MIYLCCIYMLILLWSQLVVHTTWMFVCHSIMYVHELRSHVSFAQRCKCFWKTKTNFFRSTEELSWCGGYLDLEAMFACKPFSHCSNHRTNLPTLAENTSLDSIFFHCSFLTVCSSGSCCNTNFKKVSQGDGSLSKLTRRFTTFLWKNTAGFNHFLIEHSMYLFSVWWMFLVF